MLRSLENNKTHVNPKSIMTENLVDVIVKLRQHGKKDQPPQLLCDNNFFLKMEKIWVGRTTLNGEKKEDGLNSFFKKGL